MLVCCSELVSTISYGCVATSVPLQSMNLCKSGVECHYSGVRIAAASTDYKALMETLGAVRSIADNWIARENIGVELLVSGDNPLMGLIDGLLRLDSVSYFGGKASDGLSIDNKGISLSYYKENICLMELKQDRALRMFNIGMRSLFNTLWVADNANIKDLALKLAKLDLCAMSVFKHGHIRHDLASLNVEYLRYLTRNYGIMN